VRDLGLGDGWVRLDLWCHCTGAVRRHVDSLGEEDEALTVDLAAFGWD
jgi:hypothetical protein